MRLPVHAGSPVDIQTCARLPCNMPKKTKLPTYRTGQLAVAPFAGRLDALDQRALALWAARCAEHALPHFERERPPDDRPRQAIEAARAWARGEIRCGATRAAAVAAHAAARACAAPAARHAARAAGHAAATAHMAAHARGAAGYAITAVASAALDGMEASIMTELQWQMEPLSNDEHSSERGARDRGRTAALARAFSAASADQPEQRRTDLVLRHTPPCTVGVRLNALREAR